MESKLRILLYVVLLVILNILECSSKDLERELTIAIKPGMQECFFQEVKVGETLDIEYQVTDGGQGDLDINFAVYGISGEALVRDFRKADGSHRTKMTEAGIYKVCWDNSMSRFNSKTVFFGLVVESSDSEEMMIWEDDGDYPYRPEDIYDIKVEDIKDSMDRIRNDLTKTRVTQDQLKAFESRDRNTVENNFYLINTFSFLNVFIMLSAGYIQVLLLRSLFDEKSRLNKIWKSSSSSRSTYS